MALNRHWLIDQYAYKRRSIREIAQMTGQTYSIVRRQLLAAGITLRRRGDPKWREKLPHV